MSNRSPRDAPRKEYGWICCILASPRSHLCSLKNKSKSSSTYSGTARIPQYPIVGAAASAGGLLIPHFSVGSEGLSCLIRVRKREGGRRGEKPREIANARAIHHSTTSTCRAMMVIRLPRSEHNETTLASPSFTGVEPGQSDMFMAWK